MTLSFNVERTVTEQVTLHLTISDIAMMLRKQGVSVPPHEEITMRDADSHPIFGGYITLKWEATTHQGGEN